MPVDLTHTGQRVAEVNDTSVWLLLTFDAYWPLSVRPARSDHSDNRCAVNVMKGHSLLDVFVCVHLRCEVI